MNKKILLAAAAALLLQTAAADESKRTLKTNYQELYSQLPGDAETVGGMFKEGAFYGRLRSNSFYYRWEEESSSREDHLISGLGGSLLYKSARFAAFDVTAGYYFGYAFFDSGNVPVNLLKSGKDVVSRQEYSENGHKWMGVLAQAYLRYSGIPHSELLVGRQIVESFFAKSNDSKMIPNTFEGALFKSKALGSTALQLGYLTRQKLRDHTSFHSVLAYDAWEENDDGAMHKGLSVDRLAAAGVERDAPLIVGDLRNTSLPNLKLDAAFYAVPELLSNVMAEANYKIALDGFTLTPGLRYIKQFDNGAGKIGGAAYNGKAAAGYTETDSNRAAYDDPDSLDSQMVAARLVGKYENYTLNLAFSKVFDEADLVAPWRGFPTAGYTRSMARYNWSANTKSYRILLSRNANKKGVYSDLYSEFSLLHSDADESKGYFDENFYYAGFVQNIPGMVDLSWRLRLGYNDTEQADADSLDARFELNYLF